MSALHSWLYSLLTLTAITLSWQKENLLPSNDVCRLFKDGVILRKPGTCNEGIICENFRSKPYMTCPSDKQWFLVSGTCNAKKPSDSYCASPCKATSPQFVLDSKNCNQWFQCNGKTEIHHGKCPTNQLFNQKLQQCTYDDQTTCVATFEVCDLAPTGVPFADEVNCHKYKRCKTKNAVETLTCPTGKYFDRALGDCSTKAQVDCYKHPYPDEVCGNSKIAIRNKFVDDQATCRGYFYCKDMGVGKPDPAPAWGQCSVFEFFNPILQACEDRSHVKCNEDRCDGRVDGEKEISGVKGCQYYLICGNGFTKEEAYCGDGKYFDIETSSCTTVKKSYPACA